MTVDRDVDRVAQARTRSEDFAAVFREHWPTAWRAAFAITGSRAMADDIAQDAFEKALTSRPQMDDEASFGGWVRRVATNRAIDVMRRERRLEALDPDQAIEWADHPIADPRLMAAVAAMTPDRRIPLVMRFWLEFTPTEIAESLGIPLGTVASRLRRGMDQLRDQLGDDNV